MNVETEDGQGEIAPDDQAAETPAEGQEADQGSDAPEGGEEAAAEAPEGAGEGAEAAPETEETPDPAKRAKSAVEKLTGRVGRLTREGHEKDRQLAEQNRQLEAYKAIIEGRAPAEGAPAATEPPIQAQPGTPEFDRLVDERAAQKAAQAQFTSDCNTIFDKGAEKHGEAFKESVANLNAMGLMDPKLVEAAMATDAPADVIHALGADLDEAERVLSLSPARMGVEMAKIAAKLNPTTQAPAPKPKLSNAPAPITPVGGGAPATTNIYASNLSMAEYARRRQAEGAQHARPPKH